MSGFEKQTYTQTPNSLFDVMKDMDECELKVVLYICRLTFGYHRDEIKISTRKLAEAIGMNTASVSKGAEAAVKRGLIEKITDGQNTTVWRAIVSDSNFESPLIQKMNQTVTENESQVGVKERIKKHSKEIIGASAKPPTPPEIKLFREVRGRYPNTVLYDDVVSSIQKVSMRLGHEALRDDLLGFYKAWCSKGYNPNSLAWLEWAEAGQIPVNGNWKAQKFSVDGLTPLERYMQQEGMVVNGNA